ncbi:MAG: ATP-binding protein [Bacteroidota bacterium]|jgi:PAS domain S-box-containing protein|nr:ATP-binding protein [Bacteroidota bacterium]
MKKSGDVLPAPLEQFLPLLPDAVYLLDAAGVILSVNPAVTRDTGWSADALIGRTLTDALLFTPAFRAMLLGRLRDDGRWEGESERIMPDGSIRAVHATWQRLATPINRAVFLGIERDISEQRAWEGEFEQSRKLAKIGILAEGIAHELRNPLSYTLSAAQLLDGPGLTDDVRRQCVQTIATGVKKAGMIVDNLLSLGKPRSQVTRTRVTLAQTITEAIEATSTHPHFACTRFTQKLARGLAVTGNHDMLVQVFHNVITNALNEMPHGGEITVHGERGTEGVCVRVTDTGPGVSEEQREHLFDPFFTASSSGTGTGLGLTLSYFIMKEHGGSIDVASDSGAGATFILNFPPVSEMDAG